MHENLRPINTGELMNSTGKALPAGTKLQNGKFTIKTLLGQGGFGITYLAWHRDFEKHVAIKEFFPYVFCDRDESSFVRCTHSNLPIMQKLKSKFTKEAKHIASLKHSNIISILDIFEDFGTAYFVMEYIEGCSLQELIKRDGAISAAKALKYIRAIGDALDYIHSLRIGHYDVKPGNILIDKDTDEAILIDFGLSKQFTDNDDEHTSSLIGHSNGYAPIEQYDQTAKIKFSPTTDSYSLTATFLYIISGIRPQTSTEIVSRGLIIPDTLPDKLKQIIKKGMSVQQNKRYASCKQLITDIESACQHNGSIEIVKNIRNVLKYRPRKKTIENQDDKTVISRQNPDMEVPTATTKISTNESNTLPQEVDEVTKNQLLSIQDDEDWTIAVKTNTQKGYDKYIAKYAPIKSEFQGKYLGKARSWVPGRPNPKFRNYSILILLALLLSGILIWNFSNKATDPDPLSDKEMATILNECKKSLKQDLFDGFYLDLYENESLLNDTSTIYYTRDDVIKEFMNGNHKFVVKNKNGAIMALPEADKGIDSVCVKDSPFLEYIDNNGLRRVIILFKDELYYYLGNGGKTKDGKSLYILCSKDNKYGIIDEDGNIVKDAMYHAIEPVAPNHFACKIANDSEWCYYTSDGDALGIKANYPTDTDIPACGLVIKYNNNRKYDDENNRYGFQNIKGELIIPYKFESASHFTDKGYAVVGKGKKKSNPAPLTSSEKYGIIDANGSEVLPFEFDDINLGESDTVIVAKNGKYGAIALSTKETILPCIYESCSKWENGFRVKENGHYFFIDSSGKRITTDLYDYADGGSTPTRVRMGKTWYFVNSTGNRILGPFKEASWFDENYNLANVAKNEKSGFINKKGETVIPFIFDSGSFFDESSHLAQIKYRGVLWYINNNGAFAYPGNSKPTDQEIAKQIQEEKAKQKKKA